MLKKIKNKDFRNKLFLIISVGILLCLFVFLVSVTWIGFGVKDNCRLAQEKYEGDCVEALMQTIEDENNSFAQKNSAIWALGQLGDKRALPFLEHYYTGYNKEQRTKWNEDISQYELHKAINLLNDGFNITSYFWR